MSNSRKPRTAAHQSAAAEDRAVDDQAPAARPKRTRTEPKVAMGKSHAKAAPAAASPATDGERDRAPKQKPVRDSFTMPKADFALIDALKDRAIGFKRPTRKSELLRAGLHALMALPDDGFQQALGQLTPLKTGRPKKNVRG